MSRGTAAGAMPSACLQSPWIFVGRAQQPPFRYLGLAAKPSDSTKDELLAAVLDHRGELALERIRRWAAGLKGDAETFVDALFGELSRWASRPGWEGAGFTRVVMQLADLPGHPARAIAR